MNNHHNELTDQSKTHEPIIFNNNEDPFSSLSSLLDPSYEISQSSKEAGRIAGRTASFNEGRSIGRTKGWEVGLELGYLFNFCMEILNGLKRLQQQQPRQQQLEIQQRNNDEQQSSSIDNNDNGDEIGRASCRERV